MTETNLEPGEGEDAEAQVSAEDAPAEPLLPAPVLVPPITNRFLFVDIAALRAKQLRRGALPRIEGTTAVGRESLFKPERIAMEEVRRGLVGYDLPEDDEESDGEGAE